MAQGQVGKRVVRLDSLGKVKGMATYVSDMSLPRMTYGKLFLSPYAHARIKSIDTTVAERLPGVVGIVTHRDVPQVLYGEMVRDQRVFAKEKVRYVGDVVAAVAAEDLKTAHKALSLIRVEYEELPAVFSPEEASVDEAPVIHEEIATYEAIPPLMNAFNAVKGLGLKNLCWQVDVRRGNVDEGFKQSYLVVEETYTTCMGQGAPIEPRAVLAKVEPDGKLTIWSTTQKPFGVRADTAHALGLPLSKVRVIAPPVGGGFGAKCQIGFEPHVAALAIKTGRPVKLVLSREEDMITANPRHPIKVRVKTGVKGDGTLLAREAELTLDTGYCSYLAPLTASLASILAAGPYRIPNASIVARAYYTNKPSCSMVRGPAGPQLGFAVESHMDSLAQIVGLDPLEFRMKNGFENGDRTVTGQLLEGVTLKETLQKVANDIGWTSFKPSRGKGIGLACGWWTTLIGFGSAAHVAINEDGSVTLITGAVDQGSGSTYGGLAQIAAEELQVPLDRITIVSGDTDACPWDYGGVGSRTTFNAGRAVQMAAREAKRRLFEIAAHQLEARVDDLEMEGGMVFVRGSPDRAVPVALLCAVGPFTAGPIVGTGSFNCAPPAYEVETASGSVFPSFGIPVFFSQAAEVEVDEETGCVKVNRVILCQDVGCAVNPLGIEGQLEGGVLQGIGYALTERVVFDRGRMVNPSFLDFKLPLASGVPEIRVMPLESSSGRGLEGAKGVGEAPSIATPGAIANAVARAVGVRIYELPLIPETVLSALATKG